ncbi:hypothetical protein SPI_04073 [Niveomyces insectorum RCEF 264]|uniref:Uncharacterized protein n=1 Tax=Niveomyces insectorum RCEF 264 TaxID=1081102 RepID=A0A167VEQ3_9HYPO|nr:hypothetical protein SPI_04073 [Niveomyces insectorum RCEF 264]
MHILQSFDQPLPNGEDRQHYDQYPAAVVSGPSTLAAEAPRAGITVSYSFWNRYATRILGSDQVAQGLAGKHLASWEDGRYFDVEGDVVSAAGIQLMNPVDLALCAQWPTELRFFHEHTALTVDGGSQVRADRVWVLRDGSETNNPDYIAVLDYKRVGTIRPSEFRSACMSWNGFVSGTHGYGSRFAENASILMKQAVSYAHKYNTKYIALFDWDCLVLLVLANAEDNWGGNYCFVTTIVDKRRMRRALLGFVAMAFVSHNQGMPDNFDDLYDEVGASVPGTG